MQNQIRRSAERGVHDQRVLDRGAGQNRPHRDLPRFERHERARRAVRQIDPDRMAGRRERGVRKRHAERFTDHLRSGRGAQELTATAGRGACAAADVRRLLAG